MTAILVALIGVAGSVVVARMTTGATRRKVEETHRMVTVNHHSSEAQGKQATLLDHMDDIKQLVIAQGGRMDEHIKLSDARSADEARRLAWLEEYANKN